MFITNYVPVNVNRANCTVYSMQKAFPRERLVAAAKTLQGEVMDGVVVEDGNVSFIDDPSIQWTTAEVYLAYETLQVAEVNNFSFYMVKDSDNIPQLFISRSFKKSRILINAFNMHTVLLTKKTLVDKAASIVDKTYSMLHCSQLFNTLRDIENGNAKFLDALLVYRDTQDELMCMNPLTTLMSDTTTYYDPKILKEMQALVDNPESETERVKYKDHKFYRTDTEIYEPMRDDFVKGLLDTYTKIRERKSNYIPLNDENYVTRYFFSTNHRYLVNAATFECVIIKNQHMRALLDYMATCPQNSHDKLELAWMLAKTE